MVPKERRKRRLGLKVIHKHRVGDKILRRVSELVIIEGQPKALLGWINFGGVRTPVWVAIFRSPCGDKLFRRKVALCLGGFD